MGCGAAGMGYVGDTVQGDGGTRGVGQGVCEGQGCRAVGIEVCRGWGQGVWDIVDIAGNRR